MEKLSFREEKKQNANKKETIYNITYFPSERSSKKDTHTSSIFLCNIIISIFAATCKEFYIFLAAYIIYFV